MKIYEQTVCSRARYTHTSCPEGLVSFVLARAPQRTSLTKSCLFLKVFWHRRRWHSHPMGFLGVLQGLRKQSCQSYTQGSGQRADKQLIICPHKP